MPRALRAGIEAILDYDHCGRTVFLSDDFEVRGVVWVEGEDKGMCPLRQLELSGGAPVATANTTGGEGSKQVSGRKV